MTLALNIPHDLSEVIRARDAAIRGIALAGASIDMLHPEQDRRTIQGLWRQQEELQLAADILDAVREAVAAHIMHGEPLIESVIYREAVGRVR